MKICGVSHSSKYLCIDINNELSIISQNHAFVLSYIIHIFEFSIQWFILKSVEVHQAQRHSVHFICAERRSLFNFIWELFAQVELFVTGIRGVITLSNKLNYPAEFTWTPILGERGMAFSIRPATGQVDAFKDLDCEVVFHPSFLAPEEGDFALQIHGGNPLKLKCIAQVRRLFCLTILLLAQV